MTSQVTSYREPFGLFLCFLALIQIGLYSFSMLTREPAVAFFFDPRIGLAAFEEMLCHAKHSPAVSSWLSSVILAAVGWLVYLRPGWLRGYLFVESAMALPSLIFFGVVVYADMSPSHGFSVAELALPAMVFIVFTVLPVAWVMTQLRSAGR
jgi:hypothetical protein